MGSAKSKMNKIIILFMKIWKDPVWSKYIAWGLPILIGGWLLVFWSVLVNIFSYVYNYSISTVSMPIWFLIFVVPMIALIIPTYKSLTKGKKPKYIKYKEDTFFEINWRWEWIKPNRSSESYMVSGLTPRCPECKSILDRNEYSGKLFECINDNCNWKWKRYMNGVEILNLNEINRKILTEIERKVYCKEFDIKHKSELK